jgi:hypothetical protein
MAGRVLAATRNNDGGGVGVGPLAALALGSARLHVPRSAISDRLRCKCARLLRVVQGRFVERPVFVKRWAESVALLLNKRKVRAKELVVIDVQLALRQLRCPSYFWPYAPFLCGYLKRGGSANSRAIPPPLRSIQEARVLSACTQLLEQAEARLARGHTRSFAGLTPMIILRRALIQTNLRSERAFVEFLAARR